MSNRTIMLRKKAGISSISNQLLASPNSPTLASPTNSISPQINTAPPQAVPETSSKIQETQAVNEHFLESEVILEQSVGHNISQISLRPQARLSVSQPGDFYEQEADRVAQQVMRMSLPGNSQPISLEGVSGESLQKKPSHSQTVDNNLQQSSDFESHLNANGAGSPLGDDVRAFMEPRFGVDFSDVRVHTDDAAIQMNRDLNAQAFTYGNDIYFGSRKSPGNNELMAHELTHVVQQGNGLAKSSAEITVQRQQAPATQDQTQAATPTQAQAPQQGGVQQEASADNIWDQIELRATPELLIKLQEIANAAAEQTRQQIQDLFSPYEDSLASDQTFASYAAMGPWAAAGALGASGAIGGALGGAAAQGGGTIFNQILSCSEVGQVKERARTDVGGRVRSTFTSDSDFYLNFEAEALADLRERFDTSWSAIPPERKSLPIAVPLMIRWFQMEARARYGVQSPAGQLALSNLRTQVASALEPVRTRLEELKSSQELKRIGVGAVGGALAGAGIGFAIGGPLGAGIGAVAGGIVGAVTGWLW